MADGRPAGRCTHTRDRLLVPSCPFDNVVPRQTGHDAGGSAQANRICDSRGWNTEVAEVPRQQVVTDDNRRCEQHLKILNEIFSALGEKDIYTQAHGHRVALYSMRLARRLDFSAEEIRNVGIGGLFHDVGKLAMGDHILNNRDKALSSDLRQEVHCHPLIGAALLKNIDVMKPVLDLVLFHHEREDGRGYPFGLNADEIPPGAKIISIADCFDAVTTDRPYQKGQPVETAYDVLKEGSRRFFAENYVAAFITEIETNGIIRDTGPMPHLVDELIRSIAGCSEKANGSGGLTR